MFDDGYQSIWNMDISPVCIDQMAQRNQHNRPELKWEVMDALDLTYDNEMFDLILDKSTLDAISCGDRAQMDVALMLKECQRVLKTNGYYVAISFSQPCNREHHLLRDHLKFKLNTVTIEKRNKPKHWLYICQKLEGADEVYNSNCEKVAQLIQVVMDE